MKTVYLRHNDPHGLNIDIIRFIYILSQYIYNSSVVFRCYCIVFFYESSGTTVFWLPVIAQFNQFQILGLRD